MSVNPSHRPLGTGATTITVRRRTDGNPGYVIFIGRRLWQDLGQPPRVSIHSDAPGYFAIRPASEGGYSVTNVASDGQPRISVGKSTIEAIHLPEGTYEASAGSTIIRFQA